MRLLHGGFLWPLVSVVMKPRLLALGYEITIVVNRTLNETRAKMSWARTCRSPFRIAAGNAHFSVSSLKLLSSLQSRQQEVVALMQKKCGFNFLQFFFLGNCKGIGREKAALSLQSIWVIPILTFCSFLLLLLAPSSMAVRGFFNSIRLLSFDPDVWTPWSQFLWRRG